MTLELTNIALIPARGGSKGIKNKNLRDLAGKPLIAHTIEAAKNSKSVDKVFVSTDDENIAKVAKEYGVETVPQEGVEGEVNERIQYNLAKDSYVGSGLNEIKKKGFSFKNVIFLQCTSPLTTSEDIDDAFDKFFSEELDSLLAVTSSCGGFKCGGFFWDKEGNSINYDYKNRKKRQDIPVTYLENGAFYIFSSKGFDEHENRLYGNIGYHIMPSYRSFEIDEPEDLEIAEYFMKYSLKKALEGDTNDGGKL